MRTSRSWGTAEQFVTVAVNVEERFRQAMVRKGIVMLTQGLPGHASGHDSFPVQLESFSVVRNVMGSPLWSMAHWRKHTLVKTGLSHLLKRAQLNAGFSGMLSRLTRICVGPPCRLTTEIEPSGTGPGCRQPWNAMFVPVLSKGSCGVRSRGFPMTATASGGGL